MFGGGGGRTEFGRRIDFLGGAKIVMGGGASGGYV